MIAKTTLSNYFKVNFTKNEFLTMDLVKVLVTCSDMVNKEAKIVRRLK